LPGPTLTFGFILATLLGSLFHLILGGDVRRLAAFLVAGWVGFGIGHLLGVNLGIDVLSIGSLRTVPAVFGAIVVLLLTHFMTASRRPAR